MSNPSEFLDSIPERRDVFWHFLNSFTSTSGMASSWVTLRYAGMISLVSFAVAIDKFNQTVSGHFVLVLQNLKSERLLR